MRSMHHALSMRWMMIIAFAGQRFAHLSTSLQRRRVQRIQHKSAKTIQTATRKKAKKKVLQKMAIVRPVMRQHVWKFVLRIKVLRRYRSQKLIKKFIHDYHSTRMVQRLVYKFRWKVIKCQRHIRSYLACKRARLIALQLLWDKIEAIGSNQKVLRKMSQLQTDS